VILDDVTQQVGQQVEAWTWELAGWLDRVAGIFARPEPRELLWQMTVGLLSPLPKKNGWTLAEQAGHTHPGRIQTFLCRGAWDPAALEAHVRDLVVETLGDDRDGVLIVDDTQIIKKGPKSVGVAPQHCGSTNQIENCQVIVMLAYARLSVPSRQCGGGHAFIGHRLYLPERWTKDPDRCREAGVPKDVVFATKPHQAVELFQEAQDAGVPYGWIAADGGYGQYREVRDWPTERSRRYVMAVPSSQPLSGVHAIGTDGGGQAAVSRADDLLARATRWERRSCGHGSKGERFYDWTFFTVTLPDEPPADGFTHTLMIRRSIADPGEVAYFLVHTPHTTATNTMVAVAGIRWRIEECNEQSKDLIGLDQHQVRTWTAFHHHVAVCMFAHAFAATRKALLQTPPARPDDTTGEGAHRGNGPDPSPTRRRPRTTTSGVS
jgi:SRSO17 transposase